MPEKSKRGSNGGKRKEGLKMEYLLQLEIESGNTSMQKDEREKLRADLTEQIKAMNMTVKRLSIIP